MLCAWPQIQLGLSFNKDITADDLEAVEASLDAAGSRLGRARPRRVDGGLVVEELTTAAALVSLLCRDARARLQADGWLGPVPEKARPKLAAEPDPPVETPGRLLLAPN